MRLAKEHKRYLYYAVLELYHFTKTPK